MPGISASTFCRPSCAGAGPTSSRSAAALLGLVVCIFLAWRGADFAFDAYSIGEVAESIWAPLLWPIKSTMALGLFLTALQYIVMIWEGAPIVSAEPGH